MNRMIGVGDALTSSMTDFSRFSNSPLTPAPACNRPRSSVRTAMFFIAGGHITLGDAQRKAFHHSGLADPGLTGQDRVVLAAAGENIDDLADFTVSPEHRID